MSVKSFFRIRSSMGWTYLGVWRGRSFWLVTTRSPADVKSRSPRG